MKKDFVQRARGTGKKIFFSERDRTFLFGKKIFCWVLRSESSTGGEEPEEGFFRRWVWFEKECFCGRLVMDPVPSRVFP